MFESLVLMEDTKKPHQVQVTKSIGGLQALPKDKSAAAMLVDGTKESRNLLFRTPA